jgi:hypothetical protein
VPTFSIPVCAQATSRWLFTREWRIGGEVDVRLAAAEHCFVMNVTKKIGHRVRQCCRAPATPPLPRPLRVLACRERYRLVGVDPCPVTTTVLRCPLAVSVARRFLTSSSAWRWVENKPKRSSPMRTDQPSLVGSTRKIVVIACLATIERSSTIKSHRALRANSGRRTRSSASPGGASPRRDCATFWGEVVASTRNWDTGTTLGPH